MIKKIKKMMRMRTEIDLLRMFYSGYLDIGSQRGFVGRSVKQAAIESRDFDKILSAVCSVDAVKTKGAEHHPHQRVTEIRLQELVRTGARDHRDPVLAAQAYRLG